MIELPFANPDEDCFQTLTYELVHGNINYNLESLINLSFKPFANTINQNFALTSGLDLDANFYLAYAGRSCYYFEDEFDEMFKKGNMTLFSIVNIASKYTYLAHNLSHLTDYLHNINMQFSVIGITESWLNDSLHLVDIDGYALVHHYRSNKCGGGTGLYICNSIQLKVRDDLIIGN